MHGLCSFAWGQNNNLQDMSYMFILLDYRCLQILGNADLVCTMT